MSPRTFVDLWIWWDEGTAGEVSVGSFVPGSGGAKLGCWKLDVQMSKADQCAFWFLCRPGQLSDFARVVRARGVNAFRRDCHVRCYYPIRYFLQYNSGRAVGRQLTKGSRRRKGFRGARLFRVHRRFMIVLRHFTRTRAKVGGGIFRSRIARLLCFPNGVSRSLFRRVFVVKLLLRILEDALRIRRGMECVRTDRHQGRLFIRLANQGIVSGDRSMLLRAFLDRSNARYIG